MKSIKTAAGKAFIDPSVRQCVKSCFPQIPIGPLLHDSPVIEIGRILAVGPLDMVNEHIPDKIKNPHHV